MSYANAASAGSAIRVPHVTLPKFRLPHPSRRARALMMIGVMISPAFLADKIGYCVERMFMTADQIAAQQVSDSEMMARLNVFHVACVGRDATAAQRKKWTDVAKQNGWPRYPEGGPTCFLPDRNLYGIAGLTAFNVACPTVVLSVADQRQWAAFAANHDWTAYERAGPGCVDP